MLPPPDIGLFSKILHLSKSLHGLKQALNKLYNELSSMLVEKVFMVTHFNPCVFICLTIPTILVVYVDNITAARTSKNINDIFFGFVIPGLPSHQRSIARVGHTGADPGQEQAIRVVKAGQKRHQWGWRPQIEWVPGYTGIAGHE
jgi:hypothetical protein